MTDRETERESEGGREGKSSDAAGERERETQILRDGQNKTVRDEKGRNRNRSKTEDRRRVQHISTTYSSVQQSA